MIRNFDGNLTKGIVFGGERGSPVLAASAGEVIYAGSNLRGYGNMVVIKHNDTWSSVYANNEELFVTQGQRVSAGQKIANEGDSDASRTQLYFEIRQNSKPIDPMRVLPNRWFDGIVLSYDLMLRGVRAPRNVYFYQVLKR